MRKHNEILETHADEKIIKAIGESVKDELDAQTDTELKNTIVNSLESMTEAAEKLSGNPKYQDLKTRLDDVTIGKKEVDKYQKAKIAYARKRLKGMGKLGAADLSDLADALYAAKRVLADKRIAKTKEKDFTPSCSECNRPMRENADKDFECYRCETLPGQALEGESS